MVPAGYLLKRVPAPPGWLKPTTSNIKDICSVSDCVNDNVVDVQGTWKHNSCGVANTPDVLFALAAEALAPTDGATLFYYTAHDMELPSDGWNFDKAAWRLRTPVPSAGVSDDVQVPDGSASVTLLGYDVVVFEDYLEHSPLSCNSVAEHVQVNEHCLLTNLDEAVAAISSGTFGEGCEPGVYKIFAVYRVG